MQSNFPLGIIEGFYGAPWSWEARHRYCSWLKQTGYSFYIYAPKGDSILRKEWSMQWEDSYLQKLKQFRQTAFEAGVEFGIGLSPYEIYKSYDASTKKQLIEKVRYIDSELSPDIFCTLFDDMKGDQEELAELQMQILDDVKSVCSAKRIIFCPTYYSLDPLLEELFGERPARYFETLGRITPPEVDIFWTGQKICSAEYPSDHLKEMERLLQRKPFLWDNYPVNDVWDMCNFLFLRPFTNRPSELLSHLSGHVVNPMVQPWLSMIPLASLPELYSGSSEYKADDTLARLAIDCCGDSLGASIVKDIEYFTIRGFDTLSDTERAQLKDRYAPFAETPCGSEILNWLEGKYVFDPSVFEY